jgi:hypothetical protein
VGSSTSDLSTRYAALSVNLLDEYHRRSAEGSSWGAEGVWRWMERNDARNFIMLGDPALRIRADLLK